ncbi:CaiB/BaiF CoA transferase family protein [Spongiibacter nanhainus]|nr:CaiB/BaiF CoA-transferase family protein [Spongiibacter nanhainus]
MSAQDNNKTGPLVGIRILEMAGIGPGPYACMLLADMGAEVIRIDRHTGGTGMEGLPADVTGRGRRSLALNLKSPEGVSLLLSLVETADVLIEGFRPGVMEKLGLGPDICLQRNPKLIYGRMTGWGQDGPLAKTAGHDINYIAISGMLSAFGDSDRSPPTPLNVVGDLGGGAMFLLSGVLAALVERSQSGQGQVIDAAISDGTASLLSTIHGLMGLGFWERERQSNILDGGAPFYRCYECADGRYISFGGIEPQFYQQWLERLNLDLGGTDYAVQMDKAAWPEQTRKVAQRVSEKTLDEWLAIFEGSDACVAPVVGLEEAERHPHNQARETFVRQGGVLQAAVAPRFSRTPGQVGIQSVAVGADTRAILGELGVGEDRIAELCENGAVKATDPEPS